MRLPLAALEVQHGGPAHGQGARVADGPGGDPPPHGHELHYLPGERPEAEARGQHPDQLACPLERDLLAVDRRYAQDHPALVGSDRGHIRARDGEQPYKGVLAGILANDLLAHGVPEDGIAAPQRDQIVFVQNSREARRELPEDRLFAHGREDDRLRVLDGSPRDVDLDATGSVAGGGYGEEYLGPSGTPLSLQQVR